MTSEVVTARTRNTSIPNTQTILPASLFSYRRTKAPFTGQAGVPRSYNLCRSLHDRAHQSLVFSGGAIAASGATVTISVILDTGGKATYMLYFLYSPTSMP
jgi:hypothetical protein